MTLRDNIDTNKNNRIDISSQYNEINNFILDKNKGEENLNELGKHLNNLDPRKLDNLGIKDALQSYFITPERTKLNQGIKNKVNKNESLNKKELSLLYLEMITNQSNKLHDQQLKFDGKLPIEKICNGALLKYIQNKYHNIVYTGKKIETKLPNQTQKNKTVTNPLDKLKENKGGEIRLPENLGEIKENEADFYCKRLITWAEQNFPNEIEKAKIQLGQIHKYKDKQEKEAYIKYDILMLAFQKYSNIITNKHDKIIQAAGYKEKDGLTGFYGQMRLIQQLQERISKDFPGIDKILETVKKFYEEINKNKEKTFPNDKDNNKLKKAENNYKEFNTFIENKYKEYNVQNLEKSLKKEPKSGEEMENYLNNWNKIQLFQNEVSEKEKTYGDSIKRYKTYAKNLNIIQKKYNISQYSDTLKRYNHDVQRLSHGIEYDKFNKYMELINKDPKLQVHMKNVGLLGNLLTDKTNNYFPIKEIRDIEIQKEIKQELIDKRRNNLKNNNPRLHRLLTNITGLYNGLVDSTIGIGSSLGVLILGLIGGKDETLAQMDHKENFDNRFKIDVSSSQSEAVYDSETGKFNFHLDNTTYTVASSISQMYALISGGGAIAKGATKMFTIGENIAGKIGLFSSSFITQVGGSYQEAIMGGLSGGEALGYSLLSATMQSGLELISPNEVLLGKGSGITKELIRNACKSGSKESFKMIGKIFTKNVWNEIREENIQEALQTVAGNLVNMTTNGTFGSGLGADWSWKNFASTAVITTLTTGITTGTSTGRQMAELNSSDRTKLIEYIKSNNGTYSDVMEMINDGIAGTIKIPNVNIQQLQELKGLLTNQKAETTGKTDTGNIDENYIIELPKEAEKFTESLGSRFHEERRQSRLQSDGTYAPRVEKTLDQTWISQRNGKTEVDIANTPFEELPSDWKSENLEAAKVAVGLVYDKVKNGENITPKTIEEMAEIVHNKRLERNGTEGSFENQRVPYEQLSELEKEKDRNQLLRAIETVKQGNTDYFDGKSHRIFEGNTGNAESNSKLSDKILSEINEQNSSAKLEELRNQITEQYKQATGEELELSDEQLLSILDAHEQDGKLGELTLGQLKVKIKILSETITDPKVRRFLLEAGFCGKIEYTGNIDKMKELTDSSNELLNEIDTIRNYISEIDEIYENFRKEIYSLYETNPDYNKINSIIQKYNDINGKYDLIINSLQDLSNKTTIRWQFKSLRDSIREGTYNITDSEITNLKELEDYCYRFIETKSNNLQQWVNNSNDGINIMLKNLKNFTNIDLSNGNNNVNEKAKRCDNLLYTIKRNAEYTKNDLHETYYDARQIQWKREHEQHKQEENDEIQTNKSNYFDGKSKKLFEREETQARGNNEMMDSEGLIFDSEYVTQKDAGIYRFNTKETTETQKNKPGYQSLQEAEQSLNNQIGGKYDKKLYQESFTKKHKNEDFEEDVDDFIKYATEKELNHKQIFIDLAKEASAKALFIGGPKKKDRIIEKVRNELLKEGEGLEALTDFTRATILFDNFSDFEEGLKVLEKMKNEGRILDLKIRNRLTRPGCNDIFVNIQTPDGYVSEVQFHIPEVLVFRDEKLGDLSIDRYKSDNNILDKHTLTKDIFDLSNDKYKRNLEAYNKIIDRLNEGRDKDHLLSLPKEQDQIVYDHDMYDIIRVLEVYENADNLTLEDYELFTSKGFKHENIKDLLNDLRLMKEHLCNEALNRYRKRTKK